jgi:hypothetical protein
LIRLCFDGDSTMANGDSTVTVTTNIRVKWSPSFSRGSTAEIASAAVAPQIATAPPDSTLCARVNPSHRPSTRPTVMRHKRERR